MPASTRGPRAGEFDYVNQYYGLKLTKNCAVIHASSAKRGQVVKGDGNYIYIQWEGEPKPQGPYHPTDNLTYPEVA